MSNPKIGKQIAAAIEKRENAMTTAIERRKTDWGMSDSQIADLLGLSPQAYSYWKRTGYRNITRTQYGLMARKLQFTSAENDAIIGIGSEY